MTPTLAWHFVPEDRRLQHGNGHLAEAGTTYTYIGPLKMCRAGMHASIDAIDALQYAPGPIICRVEMGGHVITGRDKIVASRRHVLWMADATAVLREFTLRHTAEAWAAAWARGAVLAVLAAQTARWARETRTAHMAWWAREAREAERVRQNDELTRLLLTLDPGGAS